MVAESNSVERRETKRYPCRTEVKLGTQTPEYSAYIANVSLGGMLLHSETPFSVGTKLNMRIVNKPYNNNLEFAGEVVWSETIKSITHLGIKIINSHQKPINDYFDVGN